MKGVRIGPSRVGPPPPRRGGTWQGTRGDPAEPRPDGSPTLVQGPETDSGRDGAGPGREGVRREPAGCEGRPSGEWEGPLVLWRDI